MPKTAEQKRAYQREFHRTHPGYFVGKMRDARAAKREHMWKVKAARGCQDCPERDPIVLEFDHRDPALKHLRLRTPRKKNNTGWVWMSWRDLMAEIEKCDVVCANCHRRRTAKQQGWNRGETAGA